MERETKKDEKIFEGEVGGKKERVKRGRDTKGTILLSSPSLSLFACGFLERPFLVIGL
jgi:hypothetical protein